jgi:hypothetical protein
MNKFGLASAYTLKKRKKSNNTVNEASTPNLLDRQFDNQAGLAVVVSDLTYVRVRENGIISVFYWIYTTAKSSVTVQAHTKTPN